MNYQRRQVANTLVMIIVFCFLCASPANGQTFNREQIVGAWTAREVIISKPVGEKPLESTTIEKTKRALLNAQFIFKNNGLFLLRLPTSAPMEFRELEEMNNKMWHIKAKERMVFVGSLDEDLMTISVKYANGYYYFSIKDTPLVLKMVKD